MDTYELWEKFSAGGRLSRQIAAGAKAELQKIIEANATVLPYALGNFVLDTSEKIQEYLDQDYPENKEV
jgi:hypothetical protein